MDTLKVLRKAITQELSAGDKLRATLLNIVDYAIEEANTTKKPSIESELDELVNERRTARARGEAQEEETSQHGYRPTSFTGDFGYRPGNSS